MLERLNRTVSKSTECETGQTAGVASLTRQYEAAHGIATRGLLFCRERQGAPGSE